MDEILRYLHVLRLMKTYMLFLLSFLMREGIKFNDISSIIAVDKNDSL